MANLLVRGVDGELVRALEERAGAHGEARKPNIGKSWKPRCAGPADAVSRRFSG